MEREMSNDADHTPAASGAFGRSDAHRRRIPANFAIVCLWALVGLALTALAIALGFRAEIAEILARAG